MTLLLTFSFAAGSARYCDQPSEHANNKWVLMNSATGDTEVVADSGMPELPTGTQSISYGVNHAALQGYNRTIVVGGPLSLSSSDRHPESICPTAHHHKPDRTTYAPSFLACTYAHSFYSYAKLMRQSLEIFADIVNSPSGSCVHKNDNGECIAYGLGGIHVGDQHQPMALRFEWSGDGSSKSQVTNATVQATRGACADFAIGGYSSSLTKLTAQQTFYDNRLMLAPAAASTSVYTQEIGGSVSRLAFGLAIPASEYLAGRRRSMGLRAVPRPG